MTPPEKRNPAGEGGASRGHQGDGDHVQCIGLPTRPRLSDNGERLIALARPAFHRQAPTAPRRLPRIGEVTVTGHLLMRIPKDAMPWEIRRTFSVLTTLPDGITVIVKLPARHRVMLDDALSGLDNLPTIELIVEGSANEYQTVADAVTALRWSAARRASELRAG